MGPSVLKFVMSLWVLTDLRRYVFGRELGELAERIIGKSHRNSATRELFRSLYMGK